MKHLVLAAATTFLLGSPALAQERWEIPPQKTYGTAATEQDAASVAALVDDFRASWGKEDVDALMALHASDTEWINAFARIWRGSDDLGAFLRDRLFANFPEPVSRREAMDMKVISTRYVGDEGAVIHIYTDSPRGVSEADSEDLRRTHIHLVLEKQDEAWKIVHTAIMDART